MPKTSRVFISYSQQDAAIATRIQENLDAAGLQVWIDKKVIQPGDSFLEKMSEGLANASYVILLCSPAAMASRWVTREWMSTLARNDSVLLPVKVAPVEMPTLLADILYIDLTQDFQEGLERIVRFIHDELKTPEELRPRVVFRGGQPTVGDFDSRVEPTALRNAKLQEIRQVAKRCVDVLALREFLFDEEIDEGSLRGESLHERLIDLLHTMNRDGQLIRFADWLQNERGACVNVQLTKIRSGAG